jgi:hypothetical protein
MKTNVTLLRGNAAALALQVSRANGLTRNYRFEKYRDAQVLRPRPALMMIWRIYPTNGRLECRWAVDRGTATDEGVSCNNLLRKAA